MVSTLIVSVNPPKKFRCPYFREEGGVKQDAKMSLFFFVLIMGGREGVKANNSNVFKYSLFLEGFPKLFIVGFTWYLI